MDRITELRSGMTETIEKMEGLLAGADEEKRELTDEEVTEYEAFDKSLDDARDEVKKLEEAEERKNKLAEEKERLLESAIEIRIPTSATKVKETITDKPWENMGEFAHMVRMAAAGVVDPRLAEIRVQQMKDGVTGGFAIPEQFSSELLSITPQEAIVKPRARVIPAGFPPDAQFTIPALDQSTNMYGGVTINHDGESDSIAESTANLRQVKLTPKRISAFVTLSAEVTNNWTASGPFIQEQMRGAMINASEADFLNGDGVNKPLGIFNTPAVINVVRGTANQISFTDVTSMFARLRMIGISQPVWITSQTTIPQLTTIADAGSNNIWVVSAADNMPPTLYGIPVLFYERSPALGSTGDLMLADLSAYLIKEGSGPTLAVSEHFRFQNDEVAFRLTMRQDGQSWWSEPLALEGATSNTVSPFIVLN